MNSSIFFLLIVHVFEIKKKKQYEKANKPGRVPHLPEEFHRDVIRWGRLRDNTPCHPLSDITIKRNKMYHEKQNVL